VVESPGDVGAGLARMPCISLRCTNWVAAH